MNQGKIQWESSEFRLFNSIDELDSILDQLSLKFNSEPCLAMVSLPSGDALAIGLGANVSVLSFVAASGDPPYFHSRGYSNDQENTFVFFYYGHWSEFPVSSLIPIETARAVVREFVETGELSPKIKWEEG